MFLKLLFLLRLLFFIIKNSTLVHPLCLNDESHALLQFKHSFLINENGDVSSDPRAYSKVESWKHNKDCCSWDGVACDDDTGHVISLDLSSSFLYGSIKSNSSLFRLVHLHRLNLADNNFNYSQIPSEIYHLFELRYLNLSDSKFYGQVPLEISKLSHLVSLDLSFNLDHLDRGGLMLENYNLRNLVENLTNLEELQLSYVKTSSVVPHLLANISSLKSLVLEGCELFGMFPFHIFHLPNLQFLNLGNNQNLNGHFPEFQQSSHLKSLMVFNNNFSGGIPNSIGNLNSLRIINVGNNMFSGLLPTSLGNLTKLNWLSLFSNKFCGKIPTSMANLTELNYIYLSENQFLSDGNLDWLGGLTKLVELYYHNNNFIGKIPSSLRNLTQLQQIDFTSNQLCGQIPLWISNLTQLTFLALDYNELQGSIPESLFRLFNLKTLSLSDNELNGSVKFDMFSNMANLFVLDISGNNLSLFMQENTNISLPKFRKLGLDSCHLNNFPLFLKFQDKLEVLSLRENNIHGLIPEWTWNASRHSLSVIRFGNNFLTGFVPSSGTTQLTSLQILHVRNNLLQGPAPILSASVIILDLSMNMLVGGIPTSICEMHSLVILDLSNNNFSETIPECLANFSNSLQFLNLEKNSLHGNIPEMCYAGNTLRMIDLSHNQLNGSVPKSLVRCTMLESLDLGNNHIVDEFPFYLGSLPALQTLDLRSNKFYGAIQKPPTDNEFPLLRIIDLSHNAFDGNLPNEYFQIWNSMKFFEEDHLTYMSIPVEFRTPEGYGADHFFYTMVLTKAGVEISYEQVPKIMAAIDLSRNKFTGDIPESLATLKILLVLNLSNNGLTGDIPSSLGNIRELESLDLSLNNLTGQIPLELVQLTFLGFLNVSNNHLTGPIPQGTQLSTFPNSSFEKNWGLCGRPLSRLCGNDEDPSSPNSTHEEDDESSSFFQLDWIVISMGFIGGIVVGVVMGQFFYEWKYEWFVKVSGTRQPTRRRRLNRN